MNSSIQRLYLRDKHLINEFLYSEAISERLIETSHHSHHHSLVERKQSFPEDEYIHQPMGYLASTNSLDDLLGKWGPGADYTGVPGVRAPP